RNLGRRDDLVQIEGPPSRQLRAVTQVQILAQRVRLPAAGARILDARAPPHAPRAVEAEEAACRLPPGLLHGEVTVERQRLAGCEPGIVAIQVSPARLHEADVLAAGCAEVGDGA